MALLIRAFEDADEPAVVLLWQAAGVTRPWNDAHADIERKRSTQRELFLVGVSDTELVATAMAGYDGHRGWVSYLAVSPAHQRLGYARLLMQEVERRLHALGCPKLNLQVRVDNQQALGFYERLGYVKDPVVSLSRRLIVDARDE